MNYTDTVNNLTFPERWIAEGVAPPTSDCKIKTIELLNRLHIEFKLKPERVAHTIMEGMYVLYKSNNCSLSIEIYNDLKMAHMVFCGDNLMSNADDNLNDTIKQFLNMSKVMEG